MPPKSNLPDRGTFEADKLINRINNLKSIHDLNMLVQEYHYESRKTFKEAIGFKYNISPDYPNKPDGRPSKQIHDPEPEEPKIVTPEIEIKDYIAPKGTRDPETQILLLGDTHFGEITPTYNMKVAKERLGNLFQKTLLITNLHRNLYPVNDLVLILLGDMVHGENPHQGAKVESIECGAVSQVYDLALPALMSFICSLKQEFLTLQIYCVPGNHGRVSLESSETSNWDLALYRALGKCDLPKGIDIKQPTDFNQIVNVQGYDFFCFHGDQTRMSNGIPYFALSRKVKEWYINYPNRFPYACCGHFHIGARLPISAKTSLFMNSALPTDDPYTLKVIGTSTVPVQWTMGVHKTMGVSWEYLLLTDEAFRPEKRS